MVSGRPVTLDYCYTDLQVKIEEFRLVILQPSANYNDTLRCNIIIYPIREPKAPTKDGRLPVNELQKTLPDGWTVDETLEGRYLFMSPRNSGIPNSWKHPDADYDVNAYELPKSSDDDVFPWHVPEYEALSYCWGIDDGSEEYLCVVSPDAPFDVPRRFPIQKNLADALRHLRYPDRERILWVDAISVNQFDICERGQYVRHMSEIYARSNNVIIWVGSESEDSTHALETLNCFSDQVEYVVSHRWGDAPTAQQRDWWRDDYEPPYEKKTWKSILSLLNRSWFERVWVLQEGLSCDRALLQCGRDIVPWVHVRKALLVLSQKTTILPPELRDRLIPYTRGLMAPPLASSENFLAWSRNQKCTNMEDKLYGILDLIDPRVAVKIRRDYNGHVWEAYSKILFAEMEVYQKLNILNHCNITTCHRGDPSWVPNLAKPIEGANIGYLSSRRFHASARSSAVAKRTPDHDYLQVTARRVTTISCVSHNLTGTFAEVIGEILSWAPKEPESDIYVSGGLSIDAYVEVLVRGRTSDRALGDSPYPSIRRLSELLTRVIASAKLDDEATRGFKDCFFVNECLFATKEGYLGVSAAGLREGESHIQWLISDHSPPTPY